MLCFFWICFCFSLRQAIRVEELYWLDWIIGVLSIRKMPSRMFNSISYLTTLAMNEWDTSWIQLSPYFLKLLIRAKTGMSHASVFSSNFKPHTVWLLQTGQLGYKGPLGKNKHYSGFAREGGGWLATAIDLAALWLSKVAPLPEFCNCYLGDRFKCPIRVQRLNGCFAYSCFYSCQ